MKSAQCTWPGILPPGPWGLRGGEAGGSPSSIVAEVVRWRVGVDGVVVGCWGVGDDAGAPCHDSGRCGRPDFMCSLAS